MHLKSWLEDKEAKTRLEDERKEQAILKAAIQAEEDKRLQRKAETRSELSQALGIQAKHQKVAKQLKFVQTKI